MRSAAQEVRDMATELLAKDATISAQQQEIDKLRELVMTATSGWSEGKPFDVLEWQHTVKDAYRAEQSNLQAQPNPAQKGE